MCPPAEEMEDSRVKESRASENRAAAPASSAPSNTALLVGFCAIVSVMSLVAAIVFGLKASEGSSSTTNNAAASIEVIQPDAPTYIIKTGDMSLEVEKPPAGDNICAGAKPELANRACYDQLNQVMTDVGPQSGANVTKGYKGNMAVTHQPITTPYFKNGMCPVNVHWHLGTEHYSAGEYDETGTFPEVLDNLDRRERRTAELARPGYHCKYYNTNEPKFNTPYVWKHCVGMEVGATYEVHWPHSAAGACGTPNQYQTPFYDGVFCRGIKSETNPEGVIDLTTTYSQIGVQAQVFTIVNDEEYYYPDLFRGMIVDGEMGQDMHYYTGSTTGTSRNNANCSSYTPITWQVDRKCHMISASSFDKMCAEMKSQRDNMEGDLYAHGSRELVDDDLVANNGQRKKKRNLNSA